MGQPSVFIHKRGFIQLHRSERQTLLSVRCFRFRELVHTVSGPKLSGTKTDKN